MVLIEPKHEGNVGAVARAMANFGLGKLVLVNPPELGDVAEKRAMHAVDILDNSENFHSAYGALLICSFVDFHE